jgi:hypothetical protein
MSPRDTFEPLDLKPNNPESDATQLTDTDIDAIARANIQIEDAKKAGREEPRITMPTRYIELLGRNKYQCPPEVQARIDARQAELRAEKGN